MTIVRSRSGVHGPQETARRRRRDAPGISAWRRVRRIVLLALAICLLPAAVSWVNALSRPRNIGIGVATVEWVRSHGGNPLVSEVENIYYTLTAPSKGGPALRSLPQVGVAEGSGEGQAPTIYRPPRIKPLIHPALKGEGVWHPAGAHTGPNPPVLLTTFRSDPEYPQFVAGVAWIDASQTHLSYVPGLAEPPEIAHRGPAEVPTSLRKRLVATFNGGFPLETSNAGLIFRGETVAPMVNGIATVVEYRDGRIDIVKWESGEHRARGSGSRSRTCRRSSTKASSTRTSQTARNGAPRSTTQCGSGAPASASTAEAT